MDPVASAITIVSSTFTLVRHVKELYHSVRDQDEHAKRLENKLTSLRESLERVRELYRSDNGRPYSLSEQKLRQAVEEVVVRCTGALSKLEDKLDKRRKPENWASVAWKQQTLAPAVEKLEKTISEEEQHLLMLLQLIDGIQLHQIREVQEKILETLRALTGDPSTGTSLSTVTSSTTNTEQVEDTDHLISRLTATLLEPGNSGSSRDGIPVANGVPTDVSESRTNPIPVEDPESNSNGRLLLKSVEDGDHDTFTSLLRDPDTSLQERDGKDRTPLLLAAELGKEKMIGMLLAEITSAPDNTTNPALPSNENGQSTTNVEAVTTNREIDFTATDKNGRTALHYCAEFDMCKIISFLLDQGADINARDDGGFPPAYYAAKKRKHDATELLLTRGATTDFDWPTTSREIEQLRDKDPNNDDQAAPVSSNE